MNLENTYKVTAAVVTYNRLELLKKVVEALKHQTYNISNIVVVNNSSIDGTEEWLKEQKGIKVIKQENLGSSGGQYKAFAESYKTECDLIWIMDDDVVPDIYCLENMLNHFAPQNVLFPLRYKPDGNPFLNDCMELNLSNPLKGIWKKVINQKDLDNIVIDVQGPTFEGPLFSKELIRKIGLPEKNFFIYADDTEYFIRASRAGFRLKLIRDAKLYRMLEAPVDGSFNWKTYYLIRNLTIIDKFYGNFIVKLLRPFAYILLFGKYWKNLSEVKTTFKAIIDGIFYKSSNTKEAVEKELNLKSTAQ